MIPSTQISAVINNPPTSGRGDVSVFYLARIKDNNATMKFQRFVQSYIKYPSGLPHRLNIIFKGFDNTVMLDSVKSIFKEISYNAILVDDTGYDLGSYFTAAKISREPNSCFLNTSSEINSYFWLAKLYVNFCLDNIELVGATGSYQVARYKASDTIEYPNCHIRTNGFMIRRDLFCEILQDETISSKQAVYEIEHGQNSITRKISGKGYQYLIVGRNGRGYSPTTWQKSETFWQGDQRNLLIKDNQTENYHYAPHSVKQNLHLHAWWNE